MRADAGRPCAGPLLATGVPTVTVALRTPFDLAAYPASPTHVCTYGDPRAELEALAAALFGETGFPGRLPAPIPGLYPVGHGLTDGPRRSTDDGPARRDPRAAGGRRAA